MLQVVEFKFTLEEMDLYNRAIKQQERQKVIEELEEWCDINEQFGVHNEKFIKDLRQKLKEMKGER